MSRADRLAWVAKGSPFRLMQPARDLRDRLRAYGYTVYDIGNTSHLEHDPPEDHTPYSKTGYPGTAKYGIGYAIDVMPPTKAGLPSLQQLGGRLLADRNAGVPGIRWLKYMNWEPTRDNGGACYQDSWKPTHARRSSTDRGHIHLSGLTGYEDSTVGAGYDPVARITGEDDDMNWDDPLGGNTGFAKRTVRQGLQDVATLRGFLIGDPATPAATLPVKDSPIMVMLTAAKAVPQLAAQIEALRTQLTEAVTPEPLDYDLLAQALLRNMAAPKD